MTNTEKVGYAVNHSNKKYRRDPGAGVFLLIFLLLILASTSSKACTCPPTSLSIAETQKYEIIFRGRVKRVQPCGDRPGEAIFKVDELYKGNAGEEFKVVFECEGECAKTFAEGEEWIIYSNYRQIDNARMDWCSRSRKYFRNSNEDYYLMLYGNDYDDELKFLREKMGLHRLLKKAPASEGRNERPDNVLLIPILLASIAAIVAFYLLLKKLLK